MKALHIDFETRSTVDLRACGLYRYAEDPSTEILCMAYAFGEEEPNVWVPSEPFPQKVMQHIRTSGLIFAWNAAFERQMWLNILNKRPQFRLPTPEDEQWRCTMAEALAMSLPGKLDDAAPAIGLDIRKDTEGYKLMMKMCKPRPPRKGEPTDVIYWYDDPADRERLAVYCKQDVRVEQAVGKRVLRLAETEQKIFHLDMQINDRGVYIDKPLCEQARRVVLRDTERLTEKMRNVTGGAVSGPSAVAQITEYLLDHGVGTDSIAKEALSNLLILDIPENCKEVLEIRQEAAKTSTAKIDSMLARRQNDGRMRGNLQYHGAGTGRWAARGAQLQNLPRPELIKDGYETAISSIMKGSNTLLEVMYGKPLTVVADCIRGMIVAAPGNDLIAADFRNIEGRGVAWLAGQEDKLDAFRAFDAGLGPELYVVAAAGVFGVPIDQADPYRQIGKVTELSMGYQGGARAFATMGKNYGLRIGDHYEKVWAAISDKYKAIATEAWPDRGKKSGMEQRAWFAAEVIKLAWRDKNYRIKEYWKVVDEAAIMAVSNPGMVFEAGKCKYKMAGSFLWCMLPSGRALCYPYARMKEIEMPYGGKRNRVVYKGNVLGKWRDSAFYGGQGVENICQGIARDIMAEAMLRAEQAGYKIVLTVHDEIIAEVKKGKGSLEEFIQLMEIRPHWCADMPITAAGWRGERYRKS